MQPKVSTGRMYSSTKLMMNTTFQDQFSSTWSLE